MEMVDAARKKNGKGGEVLQFGDKVTMKRRVNRLK